MIQCNVSDEAININAVYGLIQNSSCGAQNLFTGTVRENNLGKKVTAVAYDAFVPLAIQTLKEIASEAQKNWGSGLKIFIQHRLGKLNVGETSVLIAVSAPHRDEAYKASRYIIEEIKVRAPIWKKEYYENGETEWLKGHALCQHDIVL